MKIEKIVISSETLIMLERMTELCYDNWKDALHMFPDDKLDTSSDEFKALFSLIEKLKISESITLEVKHS